MKIGENREKKIKHGRGHSETIEIDWDQVEALMQCKPTLSMAAHYFKMSDVTLEKKIRDKYNVTFSEYRDRAMAFIKASLIQAAIHRALNKSDTMLIFCLKNIAQWADKIENKIEEVPTKELIQQAKDLIATYEKENKEVTNEPAGH